MTNRSLCKAGAYQRGLRPRPPCRRFLIVNFGPRPHTLDHTRRSLLRALVRNYIFICVIIARCNLDTQPVEEEQGKRKGRGKKKKNGRKGRRRSEIRACIYIYVYVWWRTSVRSSFRSPHVVCPVRSSFVAGEEGGANPSQDLVFTITNKTGARVRSLARITRYTFAISGSLAAGQARWKDRSTSNYEARGDIADVDGNGPNRMSNERAWPLGSTWEGYQGDFFGYFFSPFFFLPFRFVPREEGGRGFTRHERLR